MNHNFGNSSKGKQIIVENSQIRGKNMQTFGGKKNMA